MKIKIGCCGWAYLSPQHFFGLDWKKKFNSTLQAYAALFPVVEINSTFYQIPKIATVKKWRSSVDDGFEFTVKASRMITHTRKFSDPALWAFGQMKVICKVLKAKVLLLQTPANWGPSDNNIAKMERFFKKIQRGKLIITWEVRGAWLDEPKLLTTICKRFDLVHCVDPLRNDSVYCGTAKIAYFRLHGFGKPIMYHYNFSQAALCKLKKKIKSLNVRQVYVMFNNSFCYENALTFGKMLGQ